MLECFTFEEDDYLIQYPYYCDTVLIEFNVEDDHVHLLINYPPEIAISKLANSLKGVSSRLIRKKTTQPFQKNYGLRVTFQAVVQGFRLQLFVNPL